MSEPKKNQKTQSSASRPPSSGLRPPPSARSQELIDAFRAHLHTAITASQFCKKAQLAALPGAKTPDYCRKLAELPDNTLARELAAPVHAMLYEIEQAAVEFYRPLYHKQIKDPAQLAEYERIFEQLDLALAFILREWPSTWFRAGHTKCVDLLCQLSLNMIARGPEAVALLRRFQELFPSDFCGPANPGMDDDFFSDFALDTCRRVEALDRLADEFPDSIRPAARQMPGWPMLVHRHTSNRKRFEELAERLELGADYLLDTSEAARFRPDTPLVQYLNLLVCRLDHVRCLTARHSYESPEKERNDLRLWWRDTLPFIPDPLSDDLVDALRTVAKLPPLTKATATEWAEKTVVPVIMATDASDWKNCKEPVLRRIASQTSVKSRATFKHRLLSAVSATLHRLARPADGRGLKPET